MASSNLLEARNVTMEFGGLKAVDNFNLEMKENELVGLIGPNGAGKTTVFNVLTGVYKPTSGQVCIGGQDIRPLKPFEISHLGMTRTFQNIRLFKDMTVLENILVASHQHTQYGLVAAVLRTPGHFEEEEKIHTRAMDLLKLFNLDKKAYDEAGALPYGDQRKLEILRALATSPRIILLDEPAAGMNHRETEILMETIGQIRKEFGVSILLIEHDMKLVMGICERILVLDHGVLIAEGKPEVIQKHPQVIAAYLGQDLDTRDDGNSDTDNEIAKAKKQLMNQEAGH